MKQKSGGIKRLMEFTGKHRGLLTVSRILSGISSVFILGPFLCVYFAARDLVGVFAGTPLDTNSLVRWGLLALGFVVGSFGIANTLTMNVLEQTRELALLRVVAMTRRQVRRTIIAQAVIIGFIGLGLGVAGGG